MKRERAPEIEQGVSYCYSYTSSDLRTITPLPSTRQSAKRGNRASDFLRYQLVIGPESLRPEHVVFHPDPETRALYFVWIDKAHH